MVTAYNMYEMNGIVVGHGTDFIVSKVEGLFGKSDTKTTDYDRMDAWGEFPGRNMYKGRTITFTIDILGQPDPAGLNPVQEDYDNLMAALAMPDVPGQANPFELVFWRPWTVPGKRFVYAYPQKVGVVSDSDWVMGHISVVAQIKTNDPRMYALTEVTDTLNMPATSTTISENCQNNGDTAGTPIINLTINGLTSGQFSTLANANTTYLSFSNTNDSNKSVSIPWSAIVGGYDLYRTNLVNYTFQIDFRQRTMTSNGTDISGYMNPSSMFWKLQPGPNLITVNTGLALPVPATVQILHRDTWSG